MGLMLPAMAKSRHDTLRNMSRGQRGDSLPGWEGVCGGMASRFVVEHLNHLGIVAEVCREIGVAEWLDQQEPGNRQRVSMGTATVALMLNGLGLSNRRLYLVPQFFADKPVDHLLGPGIMAQDLNDDTLGRTLDWLYEHDV